ncbi:MAG TPA: thioredoxin domain-containing protein, partial [Caulobacteraceae bacterium]
MTVRLKTPLILKAERVARPFRTQAFSETLSPTIKHLGPGSRRYTRLVQDERKDGRASVGGMALAAALTLLALPAFAVPMPDDMSLGSPTAPVTVTEYASLGCPHCAAWSR